MNTPLVSRYRACLPGQETKGVKLPAIFIQEATQFDFENAPVADADCSSFTTGIYYWSAKGRRVAERVLRDLKATGVALIYPGDSDLQIHVGARHRIVKIGASLSHSSEGIE